VGRIECGATFADKRHLDMAMYPEWYKTYDSLAEAQAAAGDKQSAIANYKKSLELHSENINAVARLKKLESNPIK
jgi:predicted TPR repeat methyltransferase